MATEYSLDIEINGIIQKVGLSGSIFELDNYGYYIHSDTADIHHENPILDKMSSLLKDDEILGGPNGVYTWVIAANKDDGTVHLYSKYTLNFQETQTKHMNIIRELGYSSEELSTNQATSRSGIINKYMFAGECLKECVRENCKLQFNLLSGSFMSNIYDATSIDVSVKEQLNKILHDILPETNIEIVESDKTFITSSSKYTKMTIDKINDLIAAGFPIYKFNLENPKEANIFKTIKTSRSLAIFNSKMQQMRDMKLRTYKAIHKVDAPQDKINEINNEFPMFTLEFLEPYKITLPTGGKKTRKLKKTKKTKKLKKTRKSRKYKSKRMYKKYKSKN